MVNILLIIFFISNNVNFNLLEYIIVHHFIMDILLIDKLIYLYLKLFNFSLVFIFLGKHFVNLNWVQIFTEVGNLLIHVKELLSGWGNSCFKTFLRLGLMIKLSKSMNKSLPEWCRINFLCIFESLILLFKLKN